MMHPGGVSTLNRPEGNAAQQPLICKEGNMTTLKKKRTGRLAVLALAAALLALPGLASAATYYVNSATGNDANNGLTAGTAWKTITKAATAVPAGTAATPNVISVAAGNYNAGETFPIAFNKNFVSLTGAGAGSTTINPANTGIDALNVGAKGFAVSGFTFDNAADAIDISQGGFTVSNNVFTTNVTNGINFVYTTTNLSTSTAVGNVSITGNTFTGLSYGVYLYAYLDYNEFTPGLTASLGTVDVRNNTFTSCTYGVYMEDYYITEMYSGSATIGNQTYDTNTFTNCQYGIYFDDFYISYMEGGSTASLGSVLFNNNTLNNCSNTGIYVYGMWLEEFYGSTGTMGNMTFTNNTVTNGGSYGFYIYYYGIEDFYDGSTGTGGNATFTGNTISGCSSENIYFYYLYLYGIDSSTAKLGNLLFDNNTLTGGTYGIYVDYFDIESLYGGQGTMGNFTVNNCTFTNHTTESFTINYWGGWYLYGPSKAVIGNIYVTNNTATTSPASGYGLNFNDLYYLYDIYDTSTFTVGTINITNNKVTAYSDALYVYYDYIGDDIGENGYETPVVTTGATNITGNTLTSTNGIGADITYYCIGYEVYGKSKIYMGATNISGNTMNGYYQGLYLYFDYNAYYMYDSSMLDWKPITVHNNTIKSETSDAVYIYWYDYENGSYNEDNSRAKLPDLIFTKNTVDTKNGYGLYYYNYENPYYNYDQAYVDFGSILIDGNTFNPNKDAGMSYGIYLYVYEAANDTYDRSTSVWGDVTVSNNTIYNVSDEAIWLDYDGFPYDAYDYTTFIGGDFTISDNVIAGAAYGIDLEFDYLDVNNYGKATVGTFNVTGNTLTGITKSGIYVDMETTNNDPATATLTVGATTVRDNTITADAGGGGNGIYFYGDIEYDDVTFGMPLLSRNTISGFTDGIALQEGSSMGLAEMTMTCNWLQNNSSNGFLFQTAGDKFTALNNSITGNGAFGLSVGSGYAAVINAESNWWGDKLGPAACASCNGVDPGDAGTVDFIPWLTYEPDKDRCGLGFPWIMFTPAITGMGTK